MSDVKYIFTLISLHLLYLLYIHSFPAFLLSQLIRPDCPVALFDLQVLNHGKDNFLVYHLEDIRVDLDIKHAFSIALCFFYFGRPHDPEAI